MALFSLHLPFTVSAIWGGQGVSSSLNSLLDSPRSNSLLFILWSFVGFGGGIGFRLVPSPGLAIVPVTSMLFPPPMSWLWEPEVGGGGITSTLKLCWTSVYGSASDSSCEMCTLLLLVGGKSGPTGWRDKLLGGLGSWPAEKIKELKAYQEVLQVG